MTASSPATDSAGSRRAPPGPRGHLVAGSYFDIQRDPLDFFVRNSREHGHLFRFHAFHTRPWYHVSHPDYLEHILLRHHADYPKQWFTKIVSFATGNGILTTEGDEWTRRRHAIQPAFHRDRVADFAEAMREETEHMMAAWERLPGRPPRVELHVDFLNLALRIVARVLFQMRDDDDDTGEFYRAFQHTLDFLSYRLVHPFALPVSVPTPLNLRYRAAERTLNGILANRVAAARARGAPAGSLMAMLLDARDEHGRGLSDRQLGDEVRTAFAAGHETTASTLFWTFYLLARHPEQERRLHAEVDALAGPPTATDIPRLPFTRMVADEALRLYPPVVWLGRVAREDDEVGGFAIPAGSPLVLGFYVAQRHPDFWDNPDAFNPDRFAQTSASRPRGAYLPFGLGPRLCIGIHMALVELVVIVATVARRYRLVLDEGQEVQAELLATLRPRRGTTMRLEAR
jgi:cytochrome P450